MIVRDIIERPSSKPSDPRAAPLPPRPPVAQAKGFPIAAHRSKSSFARARKDDAIRRSGGLVEGEGRVVESVPVVQPIASTTSTSSAAAAAPSSSTSASKLSEADEVRQQVDRQNTDRVAGMSDAERRQEAEELKDRFGPGVVELMRKRRDAREMGSTSSETQQIRSQVEAQNRSRVEHMSQTEREEEMRELEERFGATLLGRLKARAAGRVKEGLTEPIAAPLAVPKSVLKASSAVAAPKLEHRPSDNDDRPAQRVRFDHKDESTPEALRTKYFPAAPKEDPKLQWMQGASAPPSDPNAPRFDLSGAPLTAERAAALPAHLGLHHHGDSPDLAGYTIMEVVHLCYSTVASQRITMMGVLGKIITHFRSATGDEDWAKACREVDVEGKGIEVACGVLVGSARSVGVISAAIDLLYASLDGNAWNWLDAQAEFRPPVQRDGEGTGVAAVPWDDVVPRLSDMVGGNWLPAHSVGQLLRILRRTAIGSPVLADAIAPVIPHAVKALVLRAPWPLEPAQPPDAEALALLLDVVSSSRNAAEALMTTNTFEPLLKFLSTAPGPDSYPLIHAVLRTYYALGRYGVAASIAATARELWAQLGSWVHLQCEASTVSPAVKTLVVGYFDLLRIWTICAIDPHRTTPEHDLTWSQASAMQWRDDALAATKALLGKNRWCELSAVLGYLVEYVQGAAINGVRGGEEELAHVRIALCEMDLVGSLPQGVSDMPPNEERDEFNSVADKVFRLHNSFSKAGKPLLVSPERERLLWWFVATTQSTETDVYLRAAVLEAAQQDALLDMGQWATSAFDLALSLKPGDEPLALGLVDDVLTAQWSTLSDTAITSALEAIGHKDSLVVLRPLLHHAVLPDLEDIQAPRRPSYLYLKATGTLRPSPPSRGAGLPLADDWVFAPLDELLSSGSSAAFTLVPADWDASEITLTRATLVLARIAHTVAPATAQRSRTLLNIMKVFMLEHNQQDVPNAVSDVWRDDAVYASLEALLGPISQPVAGAVATAASDSGPLEVVAQRFLGETPFYQFYQDLVALYESVSFGDPLFARVLMAPLAMNYPADYRRLLWIESGAIRSMRVEDPPLECGTVSAYFSPPESDKEVLQAYAKALVTGTAKGFLETVARHHVAGLFWLDDEEAQGSLRVQMMVVILSSARDEVLKALLKHDPTVVDGTGKVAEEEVLRRVSLLARLTGTRGAQRLAASGYTVE